jgi:hypothetical protein
VFLKKGDKHFMTIIESAIAQPLLGVLRVEMNRWPNERVFAEGSHLWNRRRYVKTPDTNKRVSRKRPENDWTPPIEAPELRIIDQELWDCVQNRIAAVAEKYNYGNCPGLLLNLA